MFRILTIALIVVVMSATSLPLGYGAISINSVSAQFDAPMDEPMDAPMDSPMDSPKGTTSGSASGSATGSWKATR